MQQLATHDLMSYIGIHDSAQDSGRKKEAVSATDSFARMFNSLVTRQENTNQNSHLEREIRDFAPQSDSQRHDRIDTRHDTDEIRGRRDEPVGKDDVRSEETNINEEKSEKAAVEKKQENTERTDTMQDRSKKAETDESGQTAKANRENVNEDDGDAVETILSSLSALLERLKAGNKAGSDGVKAAAGMETELAHIGKKIDSLLDKGTDKNTKAKLLVLQKLLKNIRAEMSSPRKNAAAFSKLSAQLQQLRKEFSDNSETMSTRMHIAARAEKNDTQKPEQNSTDRQPGNTVQLESRESAPNTRSGDSGSSFNFRDQDSASPIQKNSARADVHSAKQPTLFREQVNELINRSRVVMQDRQNGTLTLKMYPERLGNVSINLGLENGTLSGRFLVESQEAKDALLSNMQQLRERLEEEGISFGSFEVSVRDNSSRFGRQDANHKNGPDVEPPYGIDGAAREYAYTTEYAHSGSLNMII